MTARPDLAARDPLSSQVRVVCGPCNSGWMSQLQNQAKPFLTPLFEGALTRVIYAPKVQFAADSPVEEDGFEPSVPRGRERTSRAKSDLQDDNRRRSIRQAE
jgi:hypothetical protein